MLREGQVWRNGRTVVQVKDHQGFYELAEFDLLSGDGLKFRTRKNFSDEQSALNFLSGMKCEATDNRIMAL